MPQDAFTLKFTASELNAALSGAKVNKITMPAADEVVMNVFTACGGKKLVLSANALNARVCFTGADKENPKTAYNFCMLLRKHLSGAVIGRVSLVEFERIIKIDFTVKNDFFGDIEKTVYAEIMGKYSNVILAEKGVILGSLKTTALDGAARRILLKGAAYSLPPPQDKINPFEKNKAVECLNNFNGDLTDYIFKNIMGLAFLTAQNISNTYFENNKVFNADTFYNHLIDYLTADKINPCLVKLNGKTVDFNIKGKNKEFDSVLSLLEYFYDSRQTAEKFNRKKTGIIGKLNNFIKKNDKLIALLSSRINESRDYKLSTLKAELLMANHYKLQSGINKAVLEDYNSDDLTKINISLDENLNIIDNAKKYYERAGRQKRTLTATNAQLGAATAEREYLLNLLSMIENAIDMQDLAELEEELSLLSPKKSTKKTDKKNNNGGEKERVYIIDGFTVLSGRSNLQNEMLLSKTSGGDIWMHTKSYHSSHIFIVTNNEAVPSGVLLAAAQICAYHSKARNAGSVEIDYCLKKYVKKIPKSKPGAVTYSNFKTLLTAPEAHTDKLQN